MARQNIWDWGNEVGSLATAAERSKNLAQGEAQRNPGLAPQNRPPCKGVSPTKVRKVPQDSCQLPGRKGFSAIPELPNGTWFSRFWGLDSDRILKLIKGRQSGHLAQVKALRQAGCKRIFEEKVSDKHARSAAPNRNWRVKLRTPTAGPPHGYSAWEVF